MGQLTRLLHVTREDGKIIAVASELRFDGPCVVRFGNGDTFLAAGWSAEIPLEVAGDDRREGRGDERG